MNCNHDTMKDQTETEAVTDINSADVTTIKSRNAVKCEKCGCDIEPGEPIVQTYKTWRTALGHFRRSINCCEKCAPPDKRNTKTFCGFCGRIFYRLNNGRRHKHLFCSDICQYNYYNQKISHARREARIKTCPVCGAMFGALRSDSVYCSDSCRQKNYRNGSN